MGMKVYTQLYSPQLSLSLLALALSRIVYLSLVCFLELSHPRNRLALARLLNKTLVTHAQQNGPYIKIKLENRFYFFTNKFNAIIF